MQLTSWRRYSIATLAHALLTVLAAAGERAGLDRPLKSNTSKKRSLSLFQQEMRWYELIPTMPQDRLGGAGDDVSRDPPGARDFQ